MSPRSRSQKASGEKFWPFLNRCFEQADLCVFVHSPGGPGTRFPSPPPFPTPPFAATAPCISPHPSPDPPSPPCLPRPHFAQPLLHHHQSLCAPPTHIARHTPTSPLTAADIVSLLKATPPPSPTPPRQPARRPHPPFPLHVRWILLHISCSMQHPNQQ